MASGNDARFGIAKETTYGTRVTPTRFMPLMSHGLTATPNRYTSQALGMGRWTRPSVITTVSVAGPLAGEVPNTGFGYLLQGLHGNTVTPVQQAATTAYLQTHTLDTAPNKSFTVQQQTPPVTSSTLIPVDFTGVRFAGLTLSWDAGGVLTFEIPTIGKDIDTSQSLATYTAPTAWDLFGFRGGSVTVGGVAKANVVGSGSLTIGFTQRDDAFMLGGSGRIAEPVETDKPTAELSTTVDFTAITDWDAVLAETSNDVVLKFEGATIASTYKYTLEVTLPDCKATSPSPTVTGPGAVQQEISYMTSSSTNDPVVIKYTSTDTTV